MHTFDCKLDAILEMAELVGWHPTREQPWLIYHDGHELERAYGATSDEAIANFTKRYPKIVSISAAEAGVNTEEWIDGLTAKPIPFDRSEPYGFSPGDIKSINMDSTLKTIQGWMNDNPTPYKWIMKFGRQKAAATNGRITFVKEGNVGGDLLTPHMILHTVGHAICAATRLDDQLYRLIEKWVLKYARPKYNEESHILLQFCKLLHMKAAIATLKGSKSGFPDLIEVANELAGIYAKHGRVKIAPNSYCDFQVSQEQCEGIRSSIESLCAGALDSLVGGVIYDE